MDRAQLADFLRRRREALQPEDVGLRKGPRSRTPGLRREDVATLAGMSVDYYIRLEQERGPQPSQQMAAALARGLRLTLDERDHLFQLAGHPTPGRGASAEHVSPAVLRVLDRLADTPAQVVTDLSETLAQTRPAVALLGDQTCFTGPERSAIYRWFTDPASRAIYPEGDHELHSRIFVSQLRTAHVRGSQGPRSTALIRRLLPVSAEFAELWSRHEIGYRHGDSKRILHPRVGLLDLQCQALLAEDHTQALLVFTATPGTDSYEKLALLIADTGAKRR
ncbi:helix-turn-helix transcriptional regulator [Streptantibioticus ferralitis]|uniref:Helix-turn-helix transcriptional regulator n=1 Tax=Streptantibioticus ferralitis TaxID=236510 RepID=A0ABT5YVL7_9ACTN|nr:helix-turn-helix transcriptional regulator [Streptantibioticus ferralitis]MDF2255575.1 helix-turn-helix transcriptional regulator [Streptantibioticus ferralitis]